MSPLEAYHLCGSFRGSVVLVSEPYCKSIMTDVTRLYSFRLYDSVREIPYESIIIVEPAIVDCETFQASPSGCAKLSAVNKAVAQRPRDWESREEAHRWFRKRFPWKTWQQQVFDIYIVRFGHHTEKTT